MKLRQFEISIMKELICRGPEEKIMLEQLSNAMVVERRYTGAGLFVEIAVSDGCQFVAEDSRFIDDGMKSCIEHPDLDHGAGAIFWIKNGKLDTLECFAYASEWPSNEELFIINKLASEI